MPKVTLLQLMLCGRARRYFYRKTKKLYFCLRDSRRAYEKAGNWKWNGNLKQKWSDHLAAIVLARLMCCWLFFLYVLELYPRPIYDHLFC